MDCTKYMPLCEQLRIDVSQTVYYDGPPKEATTTASIDSLTPKEIAAKVLHQLPEDTVLDVQAFLVCCQDWKKLEKYESCLILLLLFSYFYSYFIIFLDTDFLQKTMSNAYFA